MMMRVYRLARWLHLRHVPVLPWMLRALNRMAFGIVLPPSAQLGRQVLLSYQGLGIVIHRRAVIGDRCVIRQGVTIGNKGRSDPYGAPVIGDDVDIGANAVIVGRITVGNGARIAAGAMVAKDVPPGALAIGNPASIVERC